MLQSLLIQYNLPLFDSEEDMLDYLQHAEGDEEKRIRKVLSALNSWD